MTSIEHIVQECYGLVPGARGSRFAGGYCRRMARQGKEGEVDNSKQGWRACVQTFEPCPR